jgi:hypothetical protein
MVLMKKCGKDLDQDSLQTLMRFLTHTQHNPDLLWKLFGRVAIDKTTPVSHMECIALSSYIINKIQYKNQLLHLSKPLYRSQNYLNTFPDTLHRIFNLVVDCNKYSVFEPSFLSSFEHAWYRLQSKAGKLISLSICCCSCDGLFFMCVVHLSFPADCWKFI